MTRPRTHSRIIAVTLSAALAVSPLPAPAQPAPCRCPQADVPPAIAPTISPTLPADVCVPTKLVDNVCAAVAPAGGPPFAFFDDFSWRSFVALVWPALDGQRGVADPAAVPGKAGPLVFETFKHDWELFQPNGAAPAAWASYAGMNPCNNVTLKYGDLVLAAFSKYTNIAQTTIGDLAAPLPSQPAAQRPGTPKLPGEYTRYLTGFNQVEFDQIVNHQWYIRKNQTNVAFAPDGKKNNPLDVKSAWAIVTPDMNPARYYMRKAYVLDLVSNQCSPRQVALVGLHIVTKTPSRPQWVWSTFMQVDAIPGTPGATAPYAYNDGSGKPMPDQNPIPYPYPPLPPDQPFAFNVTQLMPTAASTRATSAAYQQALAKLGSGVWQYYTLVMTQWPIRAFTNDDGSPGNTFPGTGATTAFANPLLETFDQDDVEFGGCMGCHNVTGGSGSGNTDFLWSLYLNANPPLVGTNASQPQFHGLNLPLRDPRLVKLKELLQRVRATPAAKPPQ